MATISSYSTLITEVQSYLARGDLASAAPGFVQLWEEGFLRDPKNHASWMDVELDDDIASGVIPVPTGFMRFRNVYVDGYGRLDQVSPEQLFGKYPRGSGTGLPVWYARTGSNFSFGPEPDSEYTIKGLYRAKPTALRSYSGDAAAHWIIVNAPDLALYGSLAEAESYVKNDARVVLWKSLYDSAIKSYRDHWFEQELSSQEALA